MSAIHDSHIAHVDAAFGAMQAEAAKPGARLVDIFTKGIRAVLALGGGLSTEAVIAIVTAGYDRLTSGDNPYIPGTNEDPASLESLIEATGRKAIDPLVRLLMPLIVAATLLVMVFALPASASAGPLKRAAKGIGKAAKVLTLPVRAVKRLFGCD